MEAALRLSLVWIVCAVGALLLTPTIPALLSLRHATKSAVVLSSNAYLDRLVTLATRELASAPAASVEPPSAPPTPPAAEGEAPGVGAETERACAPPAGRVTVGHERSDHQPATCSAENSFPPTPAGEASR